MVEVKAPGKLMLAGEWSVLEVGNPCIVMAVDKYVKAIAEESESSVINAKDLGIENKEAEFDGKELKFKEELSEEEKEKIVMAKNSVEITLRYLQEAGVETKKFNISTHSEITSITLKDGTSAKVGFGSSAAAVVAIISAVLKLHNQDIDSLEAKAKIYKLGCTAHFIGQGKVGSSFDVAASTYGGAIVYKRFDPKWLVEQIESGKQIKEIVEERWEAFEATPIKLPEDFVLNVGFVGYGASTKALVVKMRDFKASDPEKYNEIYASISKVVNELIEAINQSDKEKIKQLLAENRELLKQLAKESGNNLETKELTELIEAANALGAAAKFSGAGAGDCGIAICFDNETAEKVKATWEEKGIYPIAVNIA
ncbi:MAG: phosphomevalonate kinase [archaeon]|nr:phosphomevalonate kinase [archaeon]